MKSGILTITALLLTVMLATFTLAASANVGLSIEKAPTRHTIQDFPYTVNELSTNAISLTPNSEIGESSGERVSVDDDAVYGSSRARVTLIEFADYQGPFGKRFHDDTFPLIDENFIESNDLNFAFRDFPLAFHPYAQLAAEAAECAGEEGDKEYFLYHDYLFDKQPDWSRSVSEEEAIHFFKKYAEILELDSEDFNYCIDNRKTQREVEHDYQDGLDAGVRGTPTFFLHNNCNGSEVMIAGAVPYGTFEGEINNLLQQPCSESTDIEVSDLTIWPRTPVLGEEVNVKYIITNNGDVEVEVRTTFSLTGPNGGGGGSGCCTTMAPREERIVAFIVTPDQEGIHVLSVGAYPEGVDDSNPRNNKASVEFKVVPATNLLYLGDLDENQAVDMSDLLKLLMKWGTSDPAADLDGSGLVDKRDLELLKANWGEETMMLSANIIHSENSQCRVGNHDIAAVRAQIGATMDTVPARLADLDNDGKVTRSDLAIVRKQRDATQHGATFDRADLNCDHKLDREDINVLVSQWGEQGYDLSVADLDYNGNVNSADLTIALAAL